VFNNGPWDPKVAGPKFDLAEAKKLLGEAKAAGFSGKLRLLADTSLPAWGEAIRAQLVAAGFEIDLQNKPISEIVVAVLDMLGVDAGTPAALARSLDEARDRRSSPRSAPIRPSISMSPVSAAGW
jgi:ABC-type transport system substrate-binding protein